MLDGVTEQRVPAEEGAWRPGWGWGWGLGPLLWVSWKPSEVWGIGEVWFDLHQDPLVAMCRIDLG